jgi:putative MATE family efflux protein
MTIKQRMQSFIAPRSFYKTVGYVALPVIIQQLLNNMMGVVDGIMVSSINQVSSVGTALQIEMFVLTIVYGVAAGASIYIAQYFGAQDKQGQQKAFGFGILLSLVITLTFFFVAMVFDEAIIRFFIKDPFVVEHGVLYLNIVKYSYFPFALLILFSHAYRSILKTKIPMIVGITSMFLNIVFNYILIFGHFGFPALGIEGAAYGTLIARLVGVFMYFGFALSAREPFIGTLKNMFVIPGAQFMMMFARTWPLIVNEFFFSLGQALFIRFYGHLGTEAMDSYYVAFKLSQMFMFVVMGVNAAVAAILGTDLGQGKLAQAKEKARYFVGLGGVISLIMMVIIVISAPQLVKLYHIESEIVIKNAVLIVRFLSLRLAFRMFNVMIFSSLRAGGDSKFLTFVDAGILWLVGVPLAYALVYIVQLESLPVILLIVQSEQLVRLIIGTWRVKQGVWLQNLTHELV